MKKQLSLFVLILVSLIIAAGGMSNWPRIYIKSNTTFAGGVSGSDSTKNIPQDTVKMWLRAQGFTDTLSLNDSLRALEHRGYITLDSASVALRLAMRDSSEQVWIDSSGQANVIIPNNLKIHDDLYIDNADQIKLGSATLYEYQSLTLPAKYPLRIIARTGANIEFQGDSLFMGGTLNLDQASPEINFVDFDSYIYQIVANLDTMYFSEDNFNFFGKLHSRNADLDTATVINLEWENGASISNPSSGLMTINAATVSVTSDSMDVNGVLNIDTLKNANGFSLYNSHADTTQFTETAFKFNGNQLIKGTLQILNGTATTFTQAVNRLTIQSDTISVRAQMNINRWRATSPQSSTFLGMNAGKVNCSGADNIVIGNFAGSGLTAGGQNIFMGSYAGAAVTNKSYNVFIGDQAGRTGDAQYVTAVGYQANRYSTGYGNVALGYLAGTGAVGATGEYNTSVGYQAGNKYKQGKNNTFIGNNAGYNNVTGNRNLIWGDYKGGISPDSMVYIDNTGKDSTGAAFTLNMTSGTLARGLTITGYIKTALVTMGKILFADETPIAPVLDGADTFTRIGVTNPYTVATFGNIAKTSKSLVITEAGYYDVGVNMSIGCDQATATIHAGIALNNVVQTYAQTEYTSKDAGDVHSLSLVNAPLLAIGDSLYMMVKSDAQTDSLRIKHLNFIIKKLN